VLCIPSNTKSLGDKLLLKNLTAWLTSRGVQVYFESPLPRELYGQQCGGFYRSETRQIFVSPEENSRELLLTLAHEAGHWVGYEIAGALPKSYQRERQSYVYGWKILKLFQADVTKAEWGWSNIWNLRELQRWYNATIIEYDAFTTPFNCSDG